METKTRKFDRRLIGTWKSDRRMTFRHDVPPPSMTPENLIKLKKFYGRFLIRWGYRICHTELDGFKSRGRYEVVASDSSSVVVRCFDEIMQESQLRQIHFEGEYYWIWDGGRREYFRRIKPPL